MAVDAGDVVITFLGDTTQLDQTFATVSGKVTATNTAAAVSTIELKATQAELKAALAAVSAEGGNTVANLERLANAQAKVAVATAESKAQLAAMRESLVATKVEGGIAAEATHELGGAVTELFAAYASFEAIKGFIEHVQESVLKLELLSEKTGINITTLAGLEHVAEGAGIEFDVVGNSLVRLERAQVLALEGHRQQIDAFNRIGISMKELRTLSPEDLLFRVADAMKNAGTHGEAAASAIALFGKGGAALIPIFEEGGDALRKMTQSAGENSGVTKEAGLAAREWQEQTANLAQSFRAILIPAMEAAVPFIKGVETVGTGAAFMFRSLGSAIGALGLAMMDSLSGGLTVLDDLIHGNLTKAIADNKASAEKIGHDWNGAWMQIEKDALKSGEFIHDMWEDKKPFKPGKDELDDIGTHSKATTADLIADAKAASEKIIAEIELRKSRNTLAFTQGKIDAKTWADADVQATYDVRKANEDYLAEVVRIHKQAGEAEKASTAQKALETKAIQNMKAATDDNNKSLAEYNKENDKFKAMGPKSWEESTKQVNVYKENLDALNARPFDAQIDKVLRLNRDLKTLGIEGWGTMERRLDAASKAEKHLDDLGVHEGKLWLQIQREKLQALIAVMQMEGKSTAQEEKNLQKIERDLKKFDVTIKQQIPTMRQMTEESKQLMGQFALDIGTAMAAAVQGQISAGQALEKATLQLIGNLAQKWAAYYAALGIADLFPPNTAKGVAELAAAAALEGLAALAGGIGGSIGSGGKGGSGGAEQVNIEKGPSTAQAGPTGVSGGRNVPHFATGALVTKPMLAMVGEETEAILPLKDRRAMKEIADALGGGRGGGDIYNHFAIGGMLSTSDLTVLARRITRASSTGRMRMTVANSNRITRKA